LNLNKRPATAELLGWMLALQQMVPENVDNPLAIPGIAIKSLSNLVKNAEDQERAMKEVLKWLEERPVST